MRQITNYVLHKYEKMSGHKKIENKLREKVVLCLLNDFILKKNITIR